MGRHWYVEHVSIMPDWALPASFLILLGVYGLIIFGVISMIAGSITAIVDVATNADECGYKPLELNSQQNVHTVIYQNCSSSST